MRGIAIELGAVRRGLDGGFVLRQSLLCGCGGGDGKAKLLLFFAAQFCQRCDAGVARESRRRGGFSRALVGDAGLDGGFQLRLGFFAQRQFLNRLTFSQRALQCRDFSLLLSLEAHSDGFTRSFFGGDAIIRKLCRTTLLLDACLSNAECGLLAFECCSRRDERGGVHFGLLNGGLFGDESCIELDVCMFTCGQRHRGDLIGFRAL